MLNPITITTSNNLENLYYYQATNAPGSREFHKAIIQEVKDNIEQKHWELIPREQVLKG